MGQPAKMPTTFAKRSRKPLNEQECTCIYCERVFANKNALYWHLPHCKLRSVLRVYEVEGVVFYVYLNPRKDHQKALIRLQQEVKDAKEFLGALHYLQFYGIVRPGKVFMESVAQSKAVGRYSLLKKTPMQDAIREELLRGVAELDKNLPGAATGSV